jgi:glycosyltransferase involved in cell wall biosynthesis
MAARKTSRRASTGAARRIAVLVPCYNEEVAIGQVVAAFNRALPDAAVHVYDNNSTDGTYKAAKRAGAIVGREMLQGKGHVVRRMFADVDADIYVLVDGDATYDAPSAPAMIERLVEENLDMVVGCRVDRREEVAYRRGHRSGNRLLTGFINKTFGGKFSDILSGYRVFSRRFVKSFPGLSAGFEIETELTVHALELGMPVAEVDTPYFARPEGSESKLNTWRDGFRILWTILKLWRTERPLLFFGAVGLFEAIVAVILAEPVVATYLRTGTVPRLPTAVLATGLMVLAVIAWASGLMLDTVTRGRREMKRLSYLEHGAPRQRP